MSASTSQGTTGARATMASAWRMMDTTVWVSLKQLTSYHEIIAKAELASYIHTGRRCYWRSTNAQTGNVKCHNVTSVTSRPNIIFHGLFHQCAVYIVCII